MKNRKRTIIPNSVLPPGSKRITNADGDRVWLIRGKEYESKRAYFQYLRDAAMMAKAASDSAAAETPDGTADLKIVPIDKSHDATAAPKEESTAPKLEPINSVADA